MNEQQQEFDAQQLNQLNVEPVKPTLSFESVRFSNGDTLRFAEDEIVVFVGPNNAGKSAALREMQQFVSKHVAQKVIKDAAFRREGSQDEFRRYLEKHAQKTGGVVNYQFVGIGYSIHHTHIQFFDNPRERLSVAGFFCTRLATEARITSSNPAGSIALYRDPPSHPIHLLLTDDILAANISSLFRRAFGQDLIAFRAGGGQFPLYVGDKPPLAVGEDELSRSFVEKLLANAVPLEEQGDGMRSFASVLLFTLASDHHSIQFLDEPEAFLHPPQARLIGEFIAKERRAKSQLFIATHSTDVLDGLIAGGAEKVRIARIQREGSFNRIKELIEPCVIN
jgi:energy-coupling factor transporter ATP-binding protein EcfA2